MAWKREQTYEAVGSAVGVALAWGCVGIAALLGVVDVGILLLVVTVPAGVVLGWLVVKILMFRDREIGD